MKCPNCGDTEQQRSLPAGEERSDPIGYRCAVCGRLYLVPVAAANTPVVEPPKAEAAVPDLPGAA